MLIGVSIDHHIVNNQFNLLYHNLFAVRDSPIVAVQHTLASVESFGQMETEPVCSAFMSLQNVFKIKKKTR